MFKDENSYNLNSAFTKTEQILKATDRIKSAVGGFNSSEEIEKLSYDTLDEVIYEAEKISISCRKNLALVTPTESDFENFGSVLPFEIDSKIDRNVSNDAAFLERKYPVNINFTNGILKISTPLTFKRFYRDGNLKENYTLMVYIRNALIRWQKENNFDLFHSIEAPMVMTIARKIPTKKVSGICDCDNLENNRIANEIMDALGNTDNALVLSVYSTLVITGDKNNVGMDFILCSKPDFPAIFSIY